MKSLLPTFSFSHIISKSYLIQFIIPAVRNIIVFNSILEPMKKEKKSHEMRISDGQVKKQVLPYTIECIHDQELKANTDVSRGKLNGLDVFPVVYFVSPCRL